MENQMDKDQGYEHKRLQVIINSHTWNTEHCYEIVICNHAKVVMEKKKQKEKQEIARMKNETWCKDNSHVQNTILTCT